MKSASITVLGVPMDVTFEFDPAEAASHDCPGYPADVEVICAKVGDHDLTDLLSAAAVDAIEDALLSYMGALDQPAIDPRFAAAHYMDGRDLFGGAA